jgi:small redox-active disulfide protein 2
MDIKILGSGCASCRKLEALTRDALTQLGLEGEIEHVTDPAQIAEWGVMSTPALVIDDDVVVVGRVPEPDKLEALIAAH